MSRVRAAALLAVAAVALSACGPAAEPTPTPTAAFASEEEAFAAAEETYRAYIAASNAVDYSDPESFASLETFTTGAYQSEEREGLSQMHAEGNSNVGDLKITWFRGVDVGADSTVTARTCNDVSETDLLDSNGDSIVPDSRPTHYAIDLTFAVVGDELRIASSEVVEDAECFS